MVVPAEIRRAASRSTKSEGKYSGINKLGQIIPIDSRLTESLDRVQAQGFLADGEITDSRFYIWVWFAKTLADCEIT